MSKVTKEQYIKDLEYDMGRLTDMVVGLTEDNKKLKKDLKKLHKIQDNQILSFKLHQRLKLCRRYFLIKIYMENLTLI